MSRKFISLIIAASIAVTGMTAAPAQAGERDLARALAAIAGIAIAGAVIHDARKDKGYVAQRQYRPQYRPQYQPQRKHAYKSKRKHAYQPRHPAAERAYRQGFRDHRRVVRERRAERHHGYGGQERYSARPYGRGY
jgi:hypothetical protein